MEGYLIKFAHNREEIHMDCQMLDLGSSCLSLWRTARSYYCILWTLYLHLQTN